jgi:carboxymethylenebutenolidase
MIDKTINVPTPSGRMETFVTHPEEGGPFPAVVVYMDVWGMREELLDIARRVATTGYYCLVPDLYYRQGRVRNEFRNEHGRMVSMERLDADKQERVRAPMRKLTDAMVLEDTAALLQFLEPDRNARRGAMGSIGYCAGGRWVFRAAGTFPDRFRANASLHGSFLVTDKADSPHLLAPLFEGELYCGFAQNDYAAPLPTVEALNRHLAGYPVRYRYEIHPGARHGYALPERDIHEKRAANRDWELIFAMFNRQIPPGGRPA